MSIAHFIAPLLGSLLVVSCSRTSPVAPVAPPGGQPSLEQRVAALEQQVNGGESQLSDAEARKQYEHNLAEIKEMGLVKRAQQDFSNRFTNAIVDKWTIGYFMQTNTVWCDFQYHLPGRTETLQQEFGYTRKDGTNWSLLWGTLTRGL